MDSVKELLPVISTLVGGSLAILGGVLTGWLLQRRTQKQERDKLYREKLERIYALLCKVTVQEAEYAVETMFAKAISESRKKQDAPIELPRARKQVMHELGLLIGFYSDSLEPSFRELKGAVDNLREREAKHRRN